MTAISDARYRLVDGPTFDCIVELFSRRGYVRTLGLGLAIRQHCGSLVVGSMICFAANKAKDLVVFCGAKNLYWYSLALAEWTGAQPTPIQFDDNNRCRLCAAGCTIWFVHLDELSSGGDDETLTTIVQTADTVLLELWMARLPTVSRLFECSKADYILFGETVELDDEIPPSTIMRKPSAQAIIGDRLPILKPQTRKKTNK